MRRAHEHIKLGGDAKAASYALEALEKDPLSPSSVYLAEKTHRRLAIKMDNKADAKKYFDKA